MSLYENSQSLLLLEYVPNLVQLVDLKQRIEIEYNSIYRNQEIEVIEILLNDMFHITKDYVSLKSDFLTQDTLRLKVFRAFFLSFFI